MPYFGLHAHARLARVALIGLVGVTAPVLSAPALPESAPVITIDGRTDRYFVGRSMELLEDPGGHLDIRRVSNGAHAWFRSPDQTPNFTFTKSAYWVRFNVRNETAVPAEFILELAHPLGDYIDAYLESDRGEFRIVRTGDRRPAAARAVFHQNFLFPLLVEPNQTCRVFMRFASHDGLLEPMPLLLWQREAFVRYDQLRMLLYGVFLGMLAVMVLYNGFLTLSLREASYFYCALMILCGLVFNIAYYGFGNIYLWSDNPWLANHIHPILIAVKFTSLFLFTKYFINTGSALPLWDRVLAGATLLALISAVVSPMLEFATAIRITIPFVLLGLPLLAVVGLAAHLRGIRSARYFLLAFALYMGGAVAIGLKGAGVVPSTPLTEQFLLVGEVALAVLLSLGLADRIRILQLEKDSHRQHALQLEEEARKELAVRNEELQRLDTLKDEFLANTSHELRTPLNGIIGLSDSLGLAAELQTAPRLREDLELISSSGRRLAALIDDILDFSKLKHGDLELQLRPVDPHAVIESVLRLSRPMVQTKALVLVHDGGPVPPVLADESRLEQILFNLVGNAIKFTKEGSVTVSAEIVDRGGSVSVVVADTGIGIPPEKLEAIFESFEQADGSIAREYGGTGLGLSIARRLVRMQGGELSVTSQLNEGSRFFFTIPIADQERSATVQEQSVPSPVRQGVADLRGVPAETGTVAADADAGADTEAEVMASGGPTPSVRTLIVDDDPVNLRVLQNHLARLGHLVVEARNGREALGELEAPSHSFDLVLLDVMMPGLSGYDVCRILRKTYSASELPVIMLTARNRTPDIISGFDSGANDYLVKPYDLSELSARVETMLKLKSAAQQQSTLAALHSELELARRIQESLLPSATPSVPGLRTAVRYRAMEKVGGDYYDFAAGDGMLGVLLADASGHGVPAALIVSIVKIAFWFQKKELARPDELFAGMNRALFGNIGAEFVTAAYAVVDPVARVLRVANAGHPPILILRSGLSEPIRLRPMGRIFGVFADCAFVVEEVRLERGDRIVIFTDGAPEATAPDGAQFGMEQFEELLRGTQKEPIESAADRVLEQLTAWSGGPSLMKDDVALAFVEIE